MTLANWTMKRTRHIIPTLAELQYQLNSQAHFTKLQMKYGHIQFELNPASRHIIMRNHYRFKKLIFGINSAAEVFHKEIHQMLGNIPNVTNPYDDNIFYEHTIA